MTKLALLLAIIISNAHACPLLNKVENISVRFKQTRKITGIKMPIISSGNFTLDAGKQVLWETIKPFYSKVVISEDGFKVQDQLYSAGPLRELSSMLIQLHSGALDQEFSYKCDRQSDNKFHLFVMPKKPEFAEMIKEVEIIGINKPEQIKFTDARGDLTQVDFEN